MRKIKLIFFIGYILTIGKVIFAQNSLAPVESTFFCNDWQFKYYSDVRKLLLANDSNKPIAIAICLPSFTPEWLISIEELKNGEKVLISKTADEQIWNYSSRQNKNIKSINKIGVTVKEVEIDSVLIKQIKSIWYSYLKNVKMDIDNPPIGVDGETYYFGMFYPRYGGILSGELMSPIDDIKLTKFVELAKRLYEYTYSDKKDRKDKMKQINSLIDSLMKY